MPCPKQRPRARAGPLCPKHPVSPASPHGAGSPPATCRDRARGTPGIPSPAGMLVPSISPLYQGTAGIVPSWEVFLHRPAPGISPAVLPDPSLAVAVSLCWWLLGIQRRGLAARSSCNLLCIHPADAGSCFVLYKCLFCTKHLPAAASTALGFTLLSLTPLEGSKLYSAQPHPIPSAPWEQTLD